MAFEKYILPDSGEPNMANHLLRAIVGEYIAGEKTKLECLDAIEAHLSGRPEIGPVTLTSNERSDLQAWMTAIDAASTEAEKRIIADDLYRVCTCAAHDTWYTSRALLKARLSWI